MFCPLHTYTAEDRTHRIGQKDNVVISYVIGKGTIDDIMWPMIQKKLSVVGHTLDGKKKDMEFNVLQTNSGNQHTIQQFLKDREEIKQKRMANQRKNNGGSNYSHSNDDTYNNVKDNHKTKNNNGSLLDFVIKKRSAKRNEISETHNATLTKSFD